MKRIIIFFITLSVTSCSMALSGIRAEMPDLSEKADGIYHGTFMSVTLDVTVADHQITKINIIEHYHSPVGKNAEKITGRILQKQSLDVDTVTGATLSSQAILKAVENALKGDPV